MSTRYFLMQLTVFSALSVIGQPHKEVEKALAKNDEPRAAELLKEISIADLEDDGRVELKEFLEPLLGNTDFPTLQMVAHIKAGELHQHLNQSDSASSYFNKSLQLSKEIYHLEGQALSQYYLSRLLARKGEFEKAKKLARAGFYAARNVGDKKLQHRLGNIMSWTYFATNQDFNQILDHYAIQASLAQDLGDGSSKAGVYNNMGYDLTIAGTVRLDSLIKLVRFANDYYASAEGNQGRWYTLMNLTWLYRLKEDNKTSLAYANKSLLQARADKDRHAIIEAAFQYGEVLLEQRKVKEASPYYEEGLAQRGKEEDRDAFVFDVYYARFLWESGEKKEAIKRLVDAIAFLETGEVFYEMHARALLAEYYFEMNQLKDAWNQVKVFDDPRSSYIALESRLIVAITRARLLALEGKKAKAKAILTAYQAQTKMIGARQLSNMIVETFDRL